MDRYLSLPQKLSRFSEILFRLLAANNRQMSMLEELKSELDPKEYAKISAAFKAEHDKLTKSATTAANKIEKDSERIAYQASQGAQAASDSLKELQLRHAEIVAQIDGNSLGSAITRSLRDYETQIAAIAKKEQEIANNRKQWTNEGRLTPEVSGYLNEQQEALNQEKALYAQIKQSGVRAWPRKLIDKLFFFDPKHCEYSFLSERKGTQLPPECRPKQHGRRMYSRGANTA